MYASCYYVVYSKYILRIFNAHSRIKRNTVLPWSWDEYSAAFCKLTRGRLVNALDDVAVVKAVVVADAAADDVWLSEFSSSNCCTCVISTYSSKLDAAVEVAGRGAEN